jgi:pimeloyl-ACP methyl ester carboxylesterase
MTVDASTARFVDVDWAGSPVRIEYQWIHGDGAARRDRPLFVFLHEGLGSISMWKDFPRALCEAADLRGLVFSRPGYGRSGSHANALKFDVDYQHRQAHELVPAFFEAAEIANERPWLLGHSDGGSIALLYASRHPESVAGLVLLAPHVFVEDLSVSSIDLARQAYLETDLRERLARHHDDVDAVFWRWNHIWLDPRFRAWNIESALPQIKCPVLVVQGREDEYGTLAQVDAIERGAPQTRRVELPDCRHSPHRDQPELLIAAVERFVADAEPASRRASLPGRIAAPTATLSEEQ